MKTNSNLFYTTLLSILIGGCATQQAVMPNFKISSEIPAEAALAWIKQSATRVQVGGGIPACRYTDTGILPLKGGSPIPWSQLRTSPFSVGFTHTRGSYAVYAMDTRDAVAGWVTVIRKNAEANSGFFIDNGDECGAFYVHHKTADEKRIAETTRQVERTLSAFAALGVEIEKQSSGKTR